MKQFYAAAIFPITLVALLFSSVVTAQLSMNPELTIEPLLTSLEMPEGAEILDYDAATMTLFVTSGDGLQVIDLSDPTDPNPSIEIFAPSDAAGIDNDEVTSVSVGKDIVAVAVPADPETDNGAVVLFDFDGNVVGTIGVGALPDMITFTPDCTTLLVANEGEPDDGEDPMGSISIIDVATMAVTTIDFSGFTTAMAEAAGIRLFPGKTPAEDFEPEFISVSEDNTEAYVALQEANAIAVIDLTNNTLSTVFSLGTKDHSLPGNALDPSDRDDGINIANWPVNGMYMPDGIAAATIGGVKYIFTANEGDDRGDADDDEGADAIRLKNLEDAADVNGGYPTALDPTVFPNAGDLEEDEQLGRYTISVIDGDTDGDGDLDALFGYGGRSFSIWNAATGLQVFDSGDDFEFITANLTPGVFNSNGSADSFDGRSDNKGPEPEAVKVALIGGQYYAFIALERVGGIAVYNVSDPANAYAVTYLPLQGDDISPEDLVIIEPANSPNGEFLMAVAYEVSETVSYFRIIDNKIQLVPTMGEWGLFLYGLIMVTLGLVFIYNRRNVLVAE